MDRAWVFVFIGLNRAPPWLAQQLLDKWMKYLTIWWGPPWLACWIQQLTDPYLNFFLWSPQLEFWKLRIVIFSFLIESLQFSFPFNHKNKNKILGRRRKTKKNKNKTSSPVRIIFLGQYSTGTAYNVKKREQEIPIVDRRFPSSILLFLSLSPSYN